MPQGNLPAYRMSDAIAPHQMPVPPPGQAPMPALSQTVPTSAGLSPSWTLQKVPVDLKGEPQPQQPGDPLKMCTMVPHGGPHNPLANMGQTVSHVYITQPTAGGPQQIVQLSAAQQQALQALQAQQQGQVQQHVPIVGNVGPGGSAPMISTSIPQQQMHVSPLPIAQQLQLLQQQQATAGMTPSGPPLGLKPINTQLPTGAQSGHLPPGSMGLQSSAGMIFSTGDNQIPQQRLRAAQLARYR